MENIEPGIAVLGVFGVYLLLKALSNLYKTFLRPGKNLKKLGKWAIVTGATGKEICWSRRTTNVSCTKDWHPLIF